MKLKKAHVLIFALLLVVFISCDQDSIFADIAVEPPPLDPRIAGSSTNIVVLNNTVYIASIGSGTIHSYNNGKWSTFSADGKVVGLASTSTKLYALVYHGNDRLNASLIEFDGNDRVTIEKGDANSHSIQSIYGAGDRVFAGGRAGALWDVFQVNGSSLVRLISNTAHLTGAVFHNSDYYVSTGGKGIYKVSNANSAITGSEGNVTGIININSTISAVTWDGRIMVNTGTGFVTISKEDINYTGAMALYKEYQNQRKDSLLLLGVQTRGNYDKGYRELALVNGEMPTDGRSPVIPGGELSSVKPGNKSKYEASLARYSVHHILQVPFEVDNFRSSSASGEPLIFASTAGKGVYVLKNGLWNAQD
jgi:hypothetical protein